MQDREQKLFIFCFLSAGPKSVALHYFLKYSENPFRWRIKPVNYGRLSDQEDH